MWARLILSAAVRAYFAGTRASYTRLPRPDGVKFVRADGPEPVSVLILGTDAASGWGVRSHELGLPGFVARALRQRLGRGVMVELVDTPAGVVSDLVQLAEARTQWDVDAVLIVGGIADAAQLRDARQWRSGLERIVRISRCSPSPPKAFIVGMPRPSVLPGFRTRPNGLIDRQADTLNRASPISVRRRGTRRTSHREPAGTATTTDYGRRTTTGCLAPTWRRPSLSASSSSATHVLVQALIRRPAS